ncbi:MAG: alpha/beta hydrolase family protein [Bulleidia sp.]
MKKSISRQADSYRTEEIRIHSDNRQIYGIAYIPENGKEQHPLIIFAHELGENHTTGIPYAQRLSRRGYAVFVFDFCGGSADAIENRSSGNSREMSVMTETEDLRLVLSTAETWDFVSPGKIGLMGGSQGACVCTSLAAEKPDQISLMILLYPAFVLYDDMHRRYSSPDQVPETFGKWGNWIILGKRYISDCWNIDPYAEMRAFPGPVLLLHGDHDRIADLSYSRKAAETFPDAELHVFRDGRHGFSGELFEEAVSWILQFLKKHMPA